MHLRAAVVASQQTDAVPYALRSFNVEALICVRDSPAFAKFGAAQIYLDRETY